MRRRCDRAMRQDFKEKRSRAKLAMPAKGEERNRKIFSLFLLWRALRPLRESSLFSEID